MALPDPPASARQLDLRRTPCPLNLIRARLSLETLAPGAWLQLDLDPGEPEESVAAGLRQAGHAVRPLPHPEAPAAVRLLVQRDGG
ncbi:MAG: sulfurtransferase TusA family protein [Cyanobacteria bacterium M_surface_10_m2_119]|nr:sulfurtransferase TusA family protein [Cyanobacteria bacterium M_surface_10_m2_119]